MAPFSYSILLMFILTLAEAISSGDGVSDWPIWDLKDPKIVLIAKFAVAQHNGDGVSDWPIWDLKDPKIVLIAKFAVAQHNEKANTSLHFVNVVDGDYEVVDVKWSYKVHLLISTSDNNSPRPKKYDAFVLYIPRQKTNSMKLQEFNIHEEGALGGWRPIPSQDYQEAVVAAKFAVAEYNKKAKTNLHFVSIIHGKENKMSSVTYHLVILTKDASAAYPKKYEIAVATRPWMQDSYLELESFKRFSKFGF